MSWLFRREVFDFFEAEISTEPFAARRTLEGLVILVNVHGPRGGRVRQIGRGRREGRGGSEREGTPLFQTDQHHYPRRCYEGIQLSLTDRMTLRAHIFEIKITYAYLPVKFKCVASSLPKILRVPEN